MCEDPLSPTVLSNLRPLKAAPTAPLECTRDTGLCHVAQVLMCVIIGIRISCELSRRWLMNRERQWIELCTSFLRGKGTGRYSYLLGGDTATANPSCAAAWSPLEGPGK